MKEYTAIIRIKVYNRVDYWKNFYILSGAFRRGKRLAWFDHAFILKHVCNLSASQAAIFPGLLALAQTTLRDWNLKCHILRINCVGNKSYILLKTWEISLFIHETHLDETCCINLLRCRVRLNYTLVLIFIKYLNIQLCLIFSIYLKCNRPKVFKYVFI